MLRQLNVELEKLKFGTDRFNIDWSKWEPEFQEYYGFFSAVTELADSPEAVDLFGETELSPKHIEVRDRLVKLLLDQDQDKAGRELLRIADYRNYRRYEIWNDSDSGGRIALSTWGTGSGGQLETPAYIVRAAVVTNRLRLFEKGASLKLLVSDESFSRMDEPRALVLRYLRDSMGLQLVSAMPTKHAGALRPEFDREFSFSRMNVPDNGEIDFVSECDERIFKKDRMREVWEAQRQEVRSQAKLLFEAAESEEVSGLEVTEVPLWLQSAPVQQLLNLLVDRLDSAERRAAPGRSPSLLVSEPGLPSTRLNANPRRKTSGVMPSSWRVGDGFLSSRMVPSVRVRAIPTRLASQLPTRPKCGGRLAARSASSPLQNVGVKRSARGYMGPTKSRRPSLNSASICRTGPWPRLSNG